jgi:hypothetical protein
MFRDAPPNAPKLALRIEDDVVCPACGYNLRGLRMDGRCPECGRPAIDTFARPLRAYTGGLAEEMIRRPGGLLVILLVWWIIFSAAAGAAGLRHVVLFGAAAGLAPMMLIILARTNQLRRATNHRRGGSGRPLQAIAMLWFALCALAVGLGLAHIGLALFWSGELEMIFWAGIILVACVSAAGAQLLSAQASITVLRRLALQAPAGATVVIASGLIVVIAVGLVPLNDGLFLSLRVLGAVLGLITWISGCVWLLSCLRQAQGSVVSIGRSRR